MSGNLWEVVGTGSGAGGILVRTSEDVNSREARGGRLATGALVAELELHEDRLRFTRIAGDGPDHGWVSTCAKGSPLLLRVGDQGSATLRAAKAAAQEAPSFGQDGSTIWLLGQGTRGDIQPLVVLGQALQRRGHNVKLFASKNFRGFIESYGLGFVQHGVDIQAKTKEVTQQPENEELKRKFKEDKEAMGGDLINMVLTNEVLVDMASVFADALQVERPDLIFFGNLIGMIPLFAWRKYSIPCMHVNYFPIWLNTEENLREVWKDMLRIDRVVHEATGCGALADASFEEWLEWFRCPRRSMTAHSSQLLELAHGELAEIGDRFRDMFTGFWVIDEASAMVDLEGFGGIEGLRMMQRFFDAGSPPIYIGWGSMPIGAGVLAKALLCVKEAGQRALVVGGWMGSGLLGLEEFVEETFPDDPFGVIPFARKNVLFVNSAPHGWLFPRCAATVHHGGAGTTAAALLAGVPTVITPFSFDQQHHADWVEKLGCGAQLSMHAGGGLVDAKWVSVLRGVSSDFKIKARAKNVAELIRREKGVAEAVARVEATLNERALVKPTLGF